MSLIKFQLDTKLKTGGDGFWSNLAKEVQVSTAELVYVSSDNEFGEMCVYFDTQDWEVTKDGLIYTDSLFIDELRDKLNEIGFSTGAINDFTYSEQGMQGDVCVSFDIGSQFIKEAMILAEETI